MIKQIVEERIVHALNNAVEATILPEIYPGLRISRPDNKAHGDWSINIAMVAAKQVGRPPRDIAADLLPFVEKIDNVDHCEIAGPGFLNLFMQEDFEGSVFAEFQSWINNGLPLSAETPEKILVEFVSANPTGPLHVGHGRGAVVGDSVVRLLRRVGHEVTAEYYVNDAGKQMDNLGKSVRARLLEANNVTVDFPEDGYQGAYVVEIAAEFDQTLNFESFQSKDEQEQIALCRDFATTRILAWIKDDLSAFRITYDTWQSEILLHENGVVSEGIDALLTTGNAEKRDDTIWFDAQNFGDEKPRVLVRDNGDPTYFAADVAYHSEKLARGFDRAINFWGSDHHGYEPRVRAAMQALGQDESCLEIRFIQFVTLLKEGEAVSMSTRSGKFECLSDILDEVGPDAARFFYLLRRPESHLEFDLDLAKKQANENPVFYVQYAHARICSIQKKAIDEKIESRTFTAKDLSDPSDRDLLNILLTYPEVLRDAAKNRAPHQIVFYLQEIASVFHGYYNKQRILNAESASLVGARLALADTVKLVIADALATIGVSAPEQM